MTAAMEFAVLASLGTSRNPLITPVHHFSDAQRPTTPRTAAVALPAEECPIGRAGRNR
jgi:hypothetical protein